TRGAPCRETVKTLRAHATAGGTVRARRRAPIAAPAGPEVGPKKTQKNKPEEQEDQRRNRRMAKTLVVVESPAKAKTIEKYLGGEYAVRASYGHIRDLPKSKLGVDLDHDFAVDYVVPDDSKKHVADLKKALKGSEDLVLATDFDREGEAIAFHVASLLGFEPANAKRVTFTEI